MRWKFTLVVLKEKRNFFILEQCCPNSTTIVPVTYLPPERATTIAVNADVSRKIQEKVKRSKQLPRWHLLGFLIHYYVTKLYCTFRTSY